MHFYSANNPNKIIHNLIVAKTLKVYQMVQRHWINEKNNNNITPTQKSSRIIQVFVYLHASAHTFTSKEYCDYYYFKCDRNDESENASGTFI